MIYHPLFKLVLFLALAAPTCLLFRAGMSGHRISGRQSGLMLAAMLALTFLIRILYLRNVEIDVDTSTWLSASITFDWYPDKLRTLLTYSDSRPLTILPLIIAGWLGAPFHYATAEIVGLLLWLASAAVLFYICSLVAGQVNALIISFSLCLFVATLAPFFAAYNSEHPSILMLLACIAAFVSYLYGRWDHPWIAGFTGLVLGSLVYAKFQNVPMGMLTGIFLALALARKKAWAGLGLLLSGAILPTLLINIHYISLAKLGEFWNAYFWNYYYYSYTTQFSSLTIGQRFGLVRIVRFLFLSPYSGFYLVTLSLLISVGFFLYFKKLSTLESRLRSFLLFSIILLTLTVYAVLQAGNNFEHYKLYLLIPLLLLLAIVLSQESVWKKYILTAFMAGILAQAAVNIFYLEEPAANARFEQIDLAVIQSIQRYSQPGGPVMIWGWRDQLHVRTLRPQGFRNVHPFHFSLDSPLVPFWTNAFFEDMKVNKPQIFIEALVPQYSERAEMFLPFEKVPAVNTYVQQHYRLAEQVEGVRIFVWK